LDHAEILLALSVKSGYLELAHCLAGLRRSCDDEFDVLHGWTVMCDDVAVTLWRSGGA
jgi:hypothetical protein